MNEIHSIPDKNDVCRQREMSAPTVCCKCPETHEIR